MRFPNDPVGLTPEEYMARAMLPRTADGLVVALVPDSSATWAGSLGQLYFQHTVPDKDGMVNPVLTPQDFADGNIPEYIQYEPGVMVTTINQCGQIHSRVVFDNPRLNLSPKDQRQLAQPYNAQPVSPVPSFALLPASPYMIELAPQGMVMKTEDRQERLSNFSAQAVERHIVIKSGAETHEEFVIAVHCEGASYQMTVKGDQLDNLEPV